MKTFGAADPDAYRALARCWAATVTVVTARRRRSPPLPAVGELDGFTCTGFSPVSIEPPLILVSATNAQSPLSILTESDAFAVNLLAPDQEALGNAFSRPVVERPDLWGTFAWSPDAFGAPLLPNTAGAFSARVQQLVPAGDHTLVVGKVTAIHLGSNPDTLVYHHRGYGRFARFHE